MSQQDMMETDQLICVDHADRIIEGVDLTKRKGHEFGKDSPRGVLHRAFSLFLFDEQNRMLLTKRASEKITFPNVWTNACCSHPLHGMTPDEVDKDGSYPNFPGIQHAVRRKVRHELGMALPADLHTQFISRFHYWAADCITYGEEAPWGEHEVDYILFCKSEDPLAMTLNPDEVSDAKYVSIDEFQTMRKDPELLWSPWFLGIMDRGGLDWWADLERSLMGEHTHETIHFFDPPTEHAAAYNEEHHDRLTGVISK